MLAHSRAWLSQGEEIIITCQISGADCYLLEVRAVRFLISVMLDQPLGSAKRDFAPSTDLALTNNRYHYNSSEFVLTNTFYLLHFAFLQVIKLFFFFLLDFCLYLDKDYLQYFKITVTMQGQIAKTEFQLANMICWACS